MGYETRIRGAVAIEASGYDQLLYELDTNLSSFCIYSDGLHFLCILCGLSESYKVITSKTTEPSAESLGLAALVLDHKSDMRTSIDVIMDTVSLNDAHELYRRLHLYFGGFAK